MGVAERALARSRTSRTSLRRIAGVASGICLACYAWWATSIRPFTALSYVAVGIPVASLALVALVDRPSGGLGARTTSHRRRGDRRTLATLPWVVLLLVCAGLEGAGLTAGGRSPRVPTLSTVVDHALAWHATRGALFFAWLAAGLGCAGRTASHHSFRVR